MDLASSLGDCTAIVAYRGYCSIPDISAELSPEAAARAYAEVATYTGDGTSTSYIPRDMVAQLHAGEPVVPTEYNVRWLRCLDRNHPRECRAFLYEFGLTPAARARRLARGAL